jgi:outer membrane protein assembly factor BamB
MRAARLFAFLITLAYALPLAAQGFQYGDVIVVGDREGIDQFGTQIFLDADIRIHGRDGAFKRELFRATRFLTEPFYRDGIVYVGARSPDAIERIDAAGNRLTPFSTQVDAINFLSPGPGGGLLATNGSGEIYQFAADGTLVRFRDFMQQPQAYGGIGLAADQCTAYYATSGSMARWDMCLSGNADFWGPNLAVASNALRILTDGSFLVSVFGLFPNLGNRIIHVDSNGNLIRSYAIGGHSLALDIDGKTFWTDAGNNLLRVDIETGAILSATQTDSTIFGLSVVGEPRAGLAGAASIPSLSTSALLVLALSLGALGLIRLRMG